MIHEDYFEFPTEPGIHQARTVDDSDTMTEGDAAAGNHQPGVPIGNGDSNPGGNHLALAGLQYGVGAGVQVRAAIAWVRMAGCRKVDVEL